MCRRERDSLARYISADKESYESCICFSVQTRANAQTTVLIHFEMSCFEEKLANEEDTNEDYNIFFLLDAFRSFSFTQICRRLL